MDAEKPSRGLTEVLEDPHVATETKEVFAQGLELFQRANSANVALAFIGSLAVQISSPTHRRLAADLGRRPSHDVDFMSYSGEQRGIDEVFSDSGYELHPSVRHSREYGVKRLIYVTPGSDMRIDVFQDDLVMAHTVPFKGRLDHDLPTVKLGDLLLSKLQIHELTRNDLIDLVILLAAHELSGPGDTLDIAYIADLLSRDWGFYHTARSNLESLASSLDDFGPELPSQVTHRVQDQVRAAALAIESAPKSARWKMRARVGTRVPWYENVQEV